MALSTLKQSVQNYIMVAWSGLKAKLGIEGGGGGRGEISTRIQAHYSEIVKYLNYEELMGYLRQENLLNEEQLERLINPGPSQSKKGSMILDAIIARGEDACARFLSCIQKERMHMGHAYIARLLEGKEFSADEEALQFSSEMQKRVKKHHTALKDIDFSALVPFMLKHNLLTLAQSRLLLSDKEQPWKAAQLDVILSTKGPLAYDIFVRCLGEEESHPTHGELCRLLIDPTYTNSNGFDIETNSAMNRELQRVPRKRKNESSNTQDVTLSKRQPRQFEFEGPLAGKRYSKLMLTFQTCHHSGEWCKLEVEVQNVLSCGIPELGAVALLEEAISHIFRQNREKVLDCVDRAWQLIRKPPEIQQSSSGSNTRILQARCEHVVSCLYRYAKEYGEALQHAKNALAHLVHCDSAEDKSFAFYCSACIRLESYADQGLALDEASPEQIKEDFRLAIELARSHNIGMDVVEPHSHIRLAQQCLGSTQFKAGCVTNKDSLRDAENSLSEVNVDRLSQRSKSLFHLLKSDLYMNEGKMDEAVVSATKSLELSKTGNFAVEQQSAEARLQALVRP